jgi:hypothetical protein
MKAPTPHRHLAWIGTLTLGFSLCAGVAMAAAKPGPLGDPALTRIELQRIAAAPTGSAAATEIAITFGIPFAPGALTDARNVRIVDEQGHEIPADVTPSLRWHFRDDSIRAVRVQLRIAMPDARRTLRFVIGEPRRTSVAGWPYAEGLVDGEHGVRLPAVLATLDPRWLSGSLVAGPQQPIEAGSAYDRYFDTQFEWSRALPTADSTAWLFDRPSTLFKHYVRSGRIEHLRAAVESYRFYMGHLVRDGKCAGGWRFGKANPCDAKYVTIEPIVLAVALVGDDSLHDEALVARMLALWDTGGWSGIGGAYTRPDQAFTERHIGLGLLATVSAYELTADAGARRRIGERIGWLEAHQSDNPDGLGKDGSWRHSWQRHEGADYDPATDIRGASPWMSENIIDGLWHAWLVTADARIPPMVTAFGDYLERHGWIAPATFAIAGTSWRDDCSGAHGEIAWYWSSSQVPLARLIALQSAEGEYSDAHTVELGLPVALARYFETDAVRRRALDARLDGIAQSYAPACARNRATARRFNWNNRGAGVVPWLRQAAAAADPPGIPPRPR